MPLYLNWKQDQQDIYVWKIEEPSTSFEDSLPISAQFITQKKQQYKHHQAYLQWLASRLLLWQKLQIAPAEWQGGIDIDYKINSGDLMIRLSVETDLRFDDLTQNVYGMIEGAEFPEQIVMIGAHRDAWVCGDFVCCVKLLAYVFMYCD